MAGLVPAITSGILPPQMAGTGPAMTKGTSGDEVIGSGVSPQSAGPMIRLIRLG